jgi:hypothetical protein
VLRSIGEGGSRELRRSPVLGEVAFLRLYACNQLLEDNKEEELVDIALWWG